MRPTSVRAFDRLITGDGPFTVTECASCQYALTVPQLSDEELARYYQTEYYETYYEHSTASGGNPLYRLRRWVRRRSAMRRWRRPPYLLRGTTPGRMLDVGCGAGELLEHFAERGWETYGIDPGAAAVAAAARRGARVHQGTLRDQPWQSGSFQLITFQHALEHIADPIDALRRAGALLVPGGLLIVDVPNWSCWQRRLLFRSRWVHLDLPRHLQHFSPRALDRIATELDLRVKAHGTTSTTISTAYSLHYLLAGRFTPGWKLWLSYALGILMLPFALLGDRISGGDCCFIVMERTR
jgi:2-polyprenyl-3-methyl-5-hydroxy-6-metoxy-1,4-benzoquinol methylase